MFWRITTIRRPTRDPQVPVIQNGFPGAGHLLLVAFLMISMATLSQSGGISNRWGANHAAEICIFNYGGPVLGLACVPLRKPETTSYTDIRKGYVSGSQRSSERSLGATPFCSEIHFRIAWPVADTWSLGSDRESTDREYAKMKPFMPKEARCVRN